MTKLIWVQPGKDDGRVALFENHPDHPGGEAFVAGPPVEVALTTLVEKKLASGVLVQVSAPKPKQENVHKTKAEVDAMLHPAVPAEEKRGPGRPKKED